MNKKNLIFIISKPKDSHIDNGHHKDFNNMRYIANQFGFKEDYDTDGSINKARLEATKFFKENMNKPLTQYNLESSLPNYTDSNNEGFANIFPGARKFL